MRRYPKRGVHAPTPSSARGGPGRRCAWFRNGSSFGKDQWLYTPAVRSSHDGSSDARQLFAWLRASPLMGWSASSTSCMMQVAKPKEVAMPQRNVPRPAAVYGIDIGKNIFHVVG